MDNAAGEDLSWFWNEWFMSTMTLDQSIKAIDYNENDPSKGSLITIENLGEMALPVTALIKEENGKTGTVKLPAEIWQRGGEWTFPYKSTSKVTLVTLDPEHKLPDVNTENNALSGAKIPTGVTAAAVISNYLTAIGGADKVRAIKDLTINADGTLQGVGVKMVNRYKSPDKFEFDATAPSYNNYVLLHLKADGDSVSSVSQNQVIKNNPRKSQKNTIYRFGFFPELDYGKEGYTLTLDNALRVIGETPAYLVTVTHPDGVRVKAYFDPVTGYKLKQVTDVPNGSPTEFADYREVSGIKIPYDVKTILIGVPIELKVSNATANTGLTNEQFK
jgi:hypothetical protein